MKDLKLAVRRLSVERPPDKTHILIWSESKWIWTYVDSSFSQTGPMFEYWALMPGSPEPGEEEKDEEDYRAWCYAAGSTFATDYRSVWMIARKTLRAKLCQK